MPDFRSTMRHETLTSKTTVHCRGKSNVENKGWLKYLRLYKPLHVSVFWITLNSIQTNSLIFATIFIIAKLTGMKHTDTVYSAYKELIGTMKV